MYHLTDCELIRYIPVETSSLRELLEQRCKNFGYKMNGRVRLMLSREEKEVKTDEDLQNIEKDDLPLILLRDSKKWVNEPRAAMTRDIINLEYERITTSLKRDVNNIFKLTNEELLTIAHVLLEMQALAKFQKELDVLYKQLNQLLSMKRMLEECIANMKRVKQYTDVLGLTE